MKATLYRNSIELTATSDFQSAGNQFIGEIVGPDPKFGVAIEFRGQRSGKRGDVTTWLVDEPGGYKVRTTTRKGIRDTYYAIWALGDILVQTELSEEQARKLARQIEGTRGVTRHAAVAELGRAVEIEDEEGSIGEAAERASADPDALVKVSSQRALELEIEPGQRPRSKTYAARRRYLDRLRGIVTPDRPIELDGPPSDPVAARRELEAERARLTARLAEVDAAIAAIPGPA